MAHEFYSAAIRYAREEKLRKDSSDLVRLLAEEFFLTAPKKNSREPAQIFERPEGDLFLDMRIMGVYQYDFTAIGREQAKVKRLISSLRDFYTQRGYYSVGELSNNPEQEEIQKLMDILIDDFSNSRML